MPGSGLQELISGLRHDIYDLNMKLLEISSTWLLLHRNEL